MSIKKQLALVIACLLQIIAMLPLSASAEQADSRLKIGIAIPLTGTASWLGENMKRGVKMFLEDHPDKEKLFDIRYEDVTTTNLTQGVSAVKKLIEIEHIDALIVQMSPVANAAKPLIERAKVPTIAIVGADCAVGTKYMVKHWLPAQSEAAAVLSFLKANNLKRVALITAEQDSMLARSHKLRRLARGYLEFVLDKISAHETDLQTYALRIAMLKPDAVILNLMPGETSTLSKRLHELNFRPQIVTTVIGATEDEKRLARGGLKGAVFPDSEISKEFIERYQEEFKRYPDPATGNTYDAMLILSTAFDGSSRPSKEQINQAIRPKEFQGVMGRYGFSAELGNAYSLQAVIRKVN